MVAATIVVLLWGKGMFSVAMVQVLSIGLIAGFVLFDLRRRLPAFLPGTSQARFSVLKTLAHPSLLFALLLAGNLIAYQGSTLIVSAALGGLAVAILSVSRTIIDMIRQGLYSITLALCPDFARMEALGEFDKLRKVHRMAVAATGALTLALAASVWYEGPRLIALWTGGRIEPDATLLRLLLVLLALQTPWAASSTVATATNRHRTQAIGYFFAAIVGIATVAALVPWLGTWAVPVGLILGEAIGCYHFVIKATCQIIGENYSAFALRFWLGFATVATAVLATGWLIHNLLAGPMLVRWAVMGVSTLTVATICAWLVWLTPEDRALLSPKLRPILRFSGANA
jgi:O-antigen/teichoic acid export membrane protein